MNVASEGGLVTLGETMGLLRTVEYGPLRHARHLQLGVAGAESNVAIGVRSLETKASPTRGNKRPHTTRVWCALRYASQSGSANTNRSPTCPPAICVTEIC